MAPFVFELLVSSIQLDKVPSAYCWAKAQPTLNGGDLWGEGTKDVDNDMAAARLHLHGFNAII